ncbi:MAG: DUF4364 family protein [Ruminococcus sp.]|nr:DUF4364 family protein [Ruminococcus sp.]
MEQNTFSEGIAPGGLREKTEIKLLICYLLKKLNQPLTHTTINEILQEYSIANYFEANQAISELVKAGKIICTLQNNDEVFEITARAIYDVAEIEKSLPRSIREKAVGAALKILARERIKRESKVEVEQLEHGYHVTFTVEDVDTQMLKLTIYVADKSQVELVKRNFFNNAVEIYSDIISSLTVE